MNSLTHTRLGCKYGEVPYRGRANHRLIVALIHGGKMKKIFLIIFLIVLLLFPGCSHNNDTDLIKKSQSDKVNMTKDIMVSPTTVPSTTVAIPPLPEKIINIEENELLNNIMDLSKSPRLFDTDGEKRALIFLISKMIEYGYEIETQEFNVYNKPNSDIYSTTLWQYFDKYSGENNSIGKGTNLIATTVNPDRKKTLYITAHYDTTGDTNGIRDNSSGVAVAMEISRQLQGINLPLNIEFIFFSAEEAGMQGSAYFVSQLSQEEKSNILGCINIDVVGEKGDNEILLKTYANQINVLSLLMDECYNFSHSNSEASDHMSFYMGQIPAIYFADEKVETKDRSSDPMIELDIDKLKELSKVICNFIIDFDLDTYYNMIINSYIKEYTDLPFTEDVLGYSLVQVNKILRKDGAGSDTQYILSNSDGEQVVITKKDNRFLTEELEAEIQSFDTYNEHVSYKVIENNDNILIKYQDNWLFIYYDILEGTLTKKEAFKLLNNQDKFTNYGTLVLDLN